MLIKWLICFTTSKSCFIAVCCGHTGSRITVIFSLTSVLTSTSTAARICSLHHLWDVVWADRATLKFGGVSTHTCPGSIFSGGHTSRITSSLRLIYDLTLLILFPSFYQFTVNWVCFVWRLPCGKIVLWLIVLWLMPFTAKTIQHKLSDLSHTPQNR